MIQIIHLRVTVNYIGYYLKKVLKRVDKGILSYRAGCYVEVNQFKIIVANNDNKKTYSAIIL